MRQRGHELSPETSRAAAQAQRVFSKPPPRALVNLPQHRVPFGELPAELRVVLRVQASERPPHLGQASGIGDLLEPVGVLPDAQGPRLSRPVARKWRTVASAV